MSRPSPQVAVAVVCAGLPEPTKVAVVIIVPPEPTKAAVVRAEPTRVPEGDKESLTNSHCPICLLCERNNNSHSKHRRSTNHIHISNVYIRIPLYFVYMVLTRTTRTQEGDNPSLQNPDGPAADVPGPRVDSNPDAYISSKT